MSIADIEFINNPPVNKKKKLIEILRRKHDTLYGRSNLGGRGDDHYLKLSEAIKIINQLFTENDFKDL